MDTVTLAHAVAAVAASAAFNVNFKFDLLAHGTTDFVEYLEHTGKGSTIRPRVWAEQL